MKYNHIKFKDILLYKVNKLKVVPLAVPKNGLLTR